jgi:hypothetical protein
MKTNNEYAKAFGRLYAKTPKAVFAAVAFSYASWASGEEAHTGAETVARFVKEWRILHENGIVPQRPVTGQKGGAN